jgi:hypothetical protein
MLRMTAEPKRLLDDLGGFTHSRLQSPPTHTDFYMTYNIFQNSLGSGFAPEPQLTSCSVFRQTAYEGRNRLQVAVEF